MATRGSPISELFGADVECAICLHRFKNPRALSCLHSFCEKCLEQFQAEKGSASSIPCPLCQKVSDVPKGGVTALTLDFRAMKLLQALKDEEEKQDTKSTRLPISCDICGRTQMDGNQPHGFIHCPECAQTMCEHCGRAHGKMKASRNHTVTAVPDQVLTGGLEIKKGEAMEEGVSTFCQKHAEKNLRLFCTVCNVPICDVCTKSDHRPEDDHEHVPINEFASTLKKRIRSQLVQVDEKSQECASFISVLDTVDKSMLMQEEMFNKKIKSMVEQETKRWERNIMATRNSFLQNQRQELDKLRQKSKEVKETLAFCETEARMILEQEANDVAIALSYKNQQPLQESINQVTSERLEISLLQKISESASQQLHINASKDELSLGSLVVAIRDRRIMKIQSCGEGPYSMTFTKDGRLAVVGFFAGYCVVKQTDVKYESATKFELEKRVKAKYTSIVSLSDLRLVLMQPTALITEPGRDITSALQRAGNLNSVATDHADNIYVADKGMIHVMRPNGAFQKRLITEDLYPACVAMCPRDANVILFTHDSSKISVVDQGGKILRTITRPEWKEVTIGCDNERLLYVLWKGAKDLWTLQRYTFDGHLLDTLFENEEHGCSALILSVSPDGTAAVVTNTGAAAEVTLISTAKKIRIT